MNDDEKVTHYWRAPNAKLPVTNHRTGVVVVRLKPGDEVELSEQDIKECHLEWYIERGWLSKSPGGPVRRSRRTAMRTQG